MKNKLSDYKNQKKKENRMDKTLLKQLNNIFIKTETIREKLGLYEVWEKIETEVKLDEALQISGRILTNLKDIENEINKI